MKAFSFKKAIPITFGDNGCDEFFDLFATFSARSVKGGVLLHISADSDYLVRINGEVVSFGAYQFYPPTYSVDTVDVSRFIREGENEISVTVWHYGADSQTHIKGSAFLCYEICDGDLVMSATEEGMLVRTAKGYISHLKEEITPQLGLNYHYDERLEGGECFRAREYFGDISFIERPVSKLSLSQGIAAKEIASGCFKLSESADGAASVLMQSAELCLDGGDGRYMLFDLGEESVGILDLSVETDEPCRVMIGYGEHITDKRCRTRIGARNFAFDYYTKEGKNEFRGYFRRLGCRYIQLFILSDKVRGARVSLIPTSYPTKRKKTEIEDAFGVGRREIYDASVKTLECCMHEHYEDCPWREQAFYTLDSRNQMLCGYYAFEDGNIDFAGASLELISYGQRKDGLLSLCYPAGRDRPIPSYTLAYFIQVLEYCEHGGDTALVKRLVPRLESLLEAFLTRLDGRGLCPNFCLPEEERYWNFYEWSRTMSGEGGDHANTKDFDAPLNAYLSIALRCMSGIYSFAEGEDPRREGSERCRILSDRINAALAEVFFDRKTGLFATYELKHRGVFSVLTQALCILCGACEVEGIDTERIYEVLRKNGDGVAVPCTLAMDCFRYDAMLKLDGTAYKHVLDDIDKTYGYMLSCGATTFWETIKGESDFHGAGSLCHGWSAMPVYYYSKFARKE